MEEDSGVKAPVTRLRRRLSVEQSEDVKSPAQATPTKKRGGRLAAKPQLDLIEENAPTPASAKKRSTRRTSVKDFADAEEKPVTPSRRSTRIKSNTSIVSETAQAFDSPRAKRAVARRTSQVGSDSESSVTPVRATRRTRKDSASSVEKLELTLASKTSNTELVILTEVIIEETESSSIKSDDTTKLNENATEITPKRRSPRLKGKKQMVKTDRKSIESSNNDAKPLNDSSTKEEAIEVKPSLKSLPIKDVSVHLENLVVFPKKSNENIADSSFLLIKELDKKPRKNSSSLNKSTSALESNTFKSKRHRTQSWTIAHQTSHPEVDEGMFYSDNESVKKKFSSGKQVFKEGKKSLKHMGSGDHSLNNSEDQKSMNVSTCKELIHNTSVEKNSSNESSFVTTKARISKGMSTPRKSSKSDMNDQNISPQGNKENIQNAKDTEKLNTSTKFFEKSPAAILQSTVLFEDSDTDSKGKELQLDIGDQCVPVVDNELVEKQDTKTLESANQTNKNISVLNKTNDNNAMDDGCEPMDIDETLPNNVAEFSQKSLNQTSDDLLPKVQESTITQSPQIDNSLNKSTNKSKRKSSLTVSNNQSLENSENENKSTLILSNIKDVSSTEHNTSKSPKVSKDLLSKSVSTTSPVKEKVIDKKNISQDYSTSTPLQQKRMQKLGLQINSSIIDSSITERKQQTVQNKSKNEVSHLSNSSEATSDSGSEDEVDSSQPKNSLLDDEAEVASDDYESGDSRDDDEREYEKENEIVEKGETLDSEDEVSNDTDYEKDSFVVSSDEEDDELLSGSGDDLSLSDNELNMSKKSKNKFNERKLKNQKKASREMFEARHKLDTSDASLEKAKKSKSQKIESSEESEEENIAPVKRNKLRLDSTQENDSLNKSATNNSKLLKKSNRIRLSESVCDENANIEHEITVDGDNAQNNDDPLSVQVKLEPKTPMKDLNISTVQINDNIEEVCVQNDVSVMKSNETVDPLQATTLEEKSSSISENSEIMNDYDSVLKEQNNEKPKTLKSFDMSLNLAKKTKQNKQPIIDQLNITDPKRPKKITAGSDEVDATRLNLSNKKGDAPSKNFEDSSSSDFIDMQLLFSEDSNDFDASQKSDKKKETQNANEADDFIPLKRTPGKMNILNTEDDTVTAKNQSLNDSIKHKRCSSKGLIEEQIDDNAVKNDIHIIIDTQGTHKSADKSLDSSQNASAKKKKNKKNVSLNDTESSMINDHLCKDNYAHDEDKAIKKKEKNRKSSETRLENVTEVTKPVDDDAPEEIPYESTKNKKKTRQASETRVEEPIAIEVAENSMNNSSSGNSTKKKTKKLSESLNKTAETSEKKEGSHNISTESRKKKNKVASDQEPQSAEVINNVEESTGNSKKRKRKSSNQDDNINSEGKILQLEGSILPGRQKKKRKFSQNEDFIQISEANDANNGNQKKKNKSLGETEPNQSQDPEPKKKSKKRKERDDDDGNKISKIFKENSYEKVSVTRLPTSIINKLDDKPKKDVLEMKKSSVVSTTPFLVEDTKKRRNKPSAFLEESVYLNDTHVEKKKKSNIKKPKVLPFLPTAVTSGSGFTTNFKINVIPQEVEFVAQLKSTTNFKNDYLYGKKIKRLGTYETYKKHRSAKMSKF